MTPMEELQSDRALVCHREFHADKKIVIWSIVLADGFIIECGSGSMAETRARRLADVVNASAPEQFSREALRNTPRIDTALAGDA